MVLGPGPESDDRLGDHSARPSLPRRYTATCREDHLAIGLLAGPVEDVRGDPADIASAGGALGLHGHDFSLLHGDLVADVRTRIAARSQP